MTATTTTTTFDRDANRLSPTDVQPGQVYESNNGDRIEVVRDDIDDSKLLIRYPDRHPQLDRDGNEVTAAAKMSRESFADAASFDGFTLVDEDGDFAETPYGEWDDMTGVSLDDTEPETMPGEWSDDIPRCPECGAYMARRFDGWFPIAVCTNDMNCHGVFIDARELIDGGYFEEA